MADMDCFLCLSVAGVDWGLLVWRITRFALIRPTWIHGRLAAVSAACRTDHVPGGLAAVFAASRTVSDPGGSVAVFAASRTDPVPGVVAAASLSMHLGLAAAAFSGNT
jgi:hypothetical protein